ncbi:DUF401 family protein [Pseudodesulfovibrio tunisiensis]|uniref:DUF401 family protein n=1 Tax=Pseudodesulfovibrio tunisiensis TaxID=463192 RepID=UPI001FB3B8D1|nr:DUF401 family protein [Pseudodesulfovibrio tunisiensis]
MDLLLKFAPFLKVVAAFTVMLIGIRFKVSLGLSILAGGLVMALLFGLGVMDWATTSALALTQEKFLFLAAIVGLILMLSDALERSGQSRRLMDALSGYLRSPRVRLVFFPALIGLLPMPGGAVFSAPMIRTAAEGMPISSRNLALINHWFRHVWELAWPLYPGIILTVALADIPIASLISRTWPGVFAMFGLGWLFYLRPGVLGDVTMSADLPRAGGRIRDILRHGLPLLVAIVGAIGLETALSVFTRGIPFEWGVIAALASAVCSVMIQNRLGLPFLRAVLGKRSLWAMLSVIASIFVFKDVMHAAGVVDEMARTAGGDAALFAASVFLPFLVGAVAGVNVAFVGATFPLLLGLLGNLGLMDQKIPYLVLATFSGFTGVMISPIHVCFILTCQYFKTDLGATWKRLVPPCLCLLAVGYGLFRILL